MFLCQPCTKKRECWHPWPFAESYGKCEGCGKQAECVDCHHRGKLEPEVAHA